MQQTSTSQQIVENLSLLENTPVCAKVVDQHLNLQYMSRAGVEGLGIDDISLYYGKPYPLAFYPEDFRHKMIQKLEHARSTGQPNMMEGSIVNVKGEVKWYQSTIAPIFGEEGAVEYFHVVSIDTTEQHEAREALLKNKLKLQLLASDLVLAEEKERKRIANHLHEDVCQNLTYVKMLLHTTDEHLSEDVKPDHANKIDDVINQVVADLRELSFDLSSPNLQEMGLPSAIAHWVKDRIEPVNHMAMELCVDDETMSLEADIESLLFRSVKEVITNAINHSGGGHLCICISRQQSQMRISVKDDGRGLDPQLIHEDAKHTGLGLYSIRERMDQMNGAFELHSRVGEGCEVVLLAPLKEMAV